MSEMNMCFSKLDGVAYVPVNLMFSLFSTEASPSSGRSTPAPTPTNTGTTSPSPSKLFVGGLSWQTSSEKLREYFAMFGPVTDVLIMKDPVTQVRI